MRAGSGRRAAEEPPRAPAVTEDEHEQRKEKLRGLLAVRGDGRTEETREAAGLPRQRRPSKPSPKPARDGPEPRLSMVQQMTSETEAKQTLRRRALQEERLIRGREMVAEMDKTIAAQNRLLEELQANITTENCKFMEMQNEIEKKQADFRQLLEEESKSIQENTAMIKNLSNTSVALKSEIAKLEETFNKYKRYENILLKLSPVEWQEAQALKSPAPSHSGPQEPQTGQGVESGGESGTSSREPTLSSDNNDSVVTDCEVGIETAEHEELCSSDPQQLLDVMTELIEQNLSLIQTSTREDGAQEELQLQLDASQKKMKEEEEKLTQQVTDMTDRVSKDKERSAALKRKVQLHDSLKAEDQDVLLDALSAKVTEVHRCCVDGQMSHLSTLEKLSSIEYRMSFLLELIENIPEERLEMLRQIKDSERMSRLREEKLRLEMEKQKERMRKCMQRSLGDSKKICGRKLMPRSMPVKQKIKVCDEEALPAEDELHDYLFMAEDAE